MQLELRNISVRDFMEESLGNNFLVIYGNALEIVSISAEAKGLELLCSIPDNVPKYIIGDSARLRQICVNLLSNSIKFALTGNEK